MPDLLIASLVLLLLYNALAGTINAIAKENKEQSDDDRENDGLNPVQALHCLESFNHSKDDLNILAYCIKTLDNSELGELSGYNLKYTKNQETNKIEFKKV